MVVIGIIRTSKTTDNHKFKKLKARELGATHLVLECSIFLCLTAAFSEVAIVKKTRTEVEFATAETRKADVGASAKIEVVF